MTIRKCDFFSPWNDSGYETLSFLFQKLLADKKCLINSHFVTARIGRMISLARSVADSLFSRFDATLSTRATLSVHR